MTLPAPPAPYDESTVERLLHCSSCGSPVPLVMRPEVTCPHCSVTVAIPADFLARAEHHAALVERREEAEGYWQKMAHGASPALSNTALLLVILLPALAAGVGSSLAVPLIGLQLHGALTFPALLPGALLFAYAATAAPLRQAMFASLQGVAREGKLSCRNCGAPLEAEEGAIATTCLYCATDSLLLDRASDLAHRSTAAQKSLGEARGALRLRLRLLAILLVVSGLVFAGLAWGFVWVSTLGG